MSGDAEFIFTLLVYTVIGAMIYFVPSFVAFYRRHPNRWVILAINVVFGGTGIGWVGSLVWACTAVHRSNEPGGSHGGESGLNLFVNDVRRVGIIGAPAGAGPPSLAGAVEELERLSRLRAEGHLSEAEFAALKAGVLGRV